MLHLILPLHLIRLGKRVYYRRDEGGLLKAAGVGLGHDGRRGSGGLLPHLPSLARLMLLICAAVRLPMPFRWVSFFEAEKALVDDDIKFVVNEVVIERVREMRGQFWLFRLGFRIEKCHHIFLWYFRAESV